MRLAIFFSLLLSLTNCAGPTYIVNEELEPYVQRFEYYGNLKVVNLVADFGDPGLGDPNKDTYVGLCRTGFGTPRIIIRKSYWDAVEDLYKEELMFHELGHCVLGRDHTEDVFEDGCPMSVMHPYVVPMSCYREIHDTYMEELFNW